MAVGAGATYMKKKEPWSVQTNWSGNHVYGAVRVAEPGSIAELQELVSSHERVRALGSRHSFTDIADTSGLLVSLAQLPKEVEVDGPRSSAKVGGGVLYGRVAECLQGGGWALANLASLPHISVAGAVATGTHGSGDRNGCLSAAVSAIEAIGPSGESYRLERGDADFEGSVVALGALGIVTSLTLDIEPTFEIRQDVYTDLPWHVVERNFDEITGGAYSVSLFTDWIGASVQQVWLKNRGIAAPGRFYGAKRAGETLHMLRGGAIESVTEQGGVLGPWHERLPHFRMAFTPSRGEELQTEYFVPRGQVQTAFAALRRLGPRMTPLLLVGEIRTVAGDNLWLSGAYGEDVVSLHFTWVRDPRAVRALLPTIEAELLPLGARPHWGKCFTATSDQLAVVHPRISDFQALCSKVDPAGKFGNSFLGRIFG